MFRFFIAGAVAFGVVFWITPNHDAEAFVVPAVQTLINQKSILNNVDIKEDEHEQYCLAKNIYEEARNQDLEGMLAVAATVLNRLNSPNFPKTICKVVYQTSRMNGVYSCQFSWVCNKKLRDRNPSKSKNIVERNMWDDIFALAKDIIIEYNKGSFIDKTEGAVNFHTLKVKPRWNKSLVNTVTIGDHKFYKPRE